MNPGYELALDDLKEWNKRLVNEVRVERINAGFTYEGNIFDSGDRSLLNITGVCTLALLLTSQGKDLPDGFSWRTKDNKNIDMKASQIFPFSVTAGTYVTSCYQVSWYHKANIDALDNIDDVLNYDITTGWPE